MKSKWGMQINIIKVNKLKCGYLKKCEQHKFSAKNEYIVGYSLPNIC